MVKEESNTNLFRLEVLFPEIVSSMLGFKGQESRPKTQTQISRRLRTGLCLLAEFCEWSSCIIRVLRSLCYTSSHSHSQSRRRLPRGKHTSLLTFQGANGCKPTCHRLPNIRIRDADTSQINSPRGKVCDLEAWHDKNILRPTQFVKCVPIPKQGREEKHASWF